MMGAFFQDVRYGIRVLAKEPGVTLLAVLTLALGIGANTALFSVVNGVLLNPLPYAEPNRLVALYSRSPDSPTWSISYPNFLDWVRENRSFSGLAAYRSDDLNLTGLGEPERLPGEMISANFFPVVGVQPVLGRAFSPEEDALGAAPVVLISAGLWKRKFAAAPDAVGKSLTLNGVVYTIVGVIPERFRYNSYNFDGRKDVYVPIGQWSNPAFRDRKACMGMDAVGRLKPGVTFEQAKSDMDALARHLAEQYPEANKNWGIALIPLKQDVVGGVQPLLWLLLAAVGFVLLIACVNVANLLLARATGRTQEFAIRAALGANRGRVVRQLLTESVLLALAGGSLGLLLASLGTQAALKLLPEALPRAEEIRVDGRVLLFTLAASMLAGILFGLAPALKSSQPDLQSTLKEGRRALSGARHRAQSILVVAEVALAFALLAGAGLTIRSLSRLWNVNPGFDSSHLLTFQVSIPPAAIPNPATTRAFWRRIQDQLAAAPGIQAASLSLSARPLQGDASLPFWLEGQPKPATQADMKSSLFYLVQPGYLKAMGIPLLRGRFLEVGDNEHTRFVTVIDERFRELYFDHQDPIGKRINFDFLNMTAEIVGVVGHVKQWGLDRDATAPVQAQCYFEPAQFPDQFMSLFAGNMGLVVRTVGSPLTLVGSLRRALEQINSQQVMFNIKTMDEVVSDSLSAQRFSMILLAAFATLAVVLACVGIYGVTSYLARQRTHEIGIRLALGADPRQVLRLVLGEGARMALLGVALGLAAALGLTRFMASLLFGVSAHDPLTLAGVAGLLIFVALLACYVPARRATKVDPMVALRYE